MTASAHPLRVKFIARVKLPDGNVGDNFERRFPNREPAWGECRFIFDRGCRDYDWLVVYDDLPRDKPEEQLACPRENTLLITGEPSSITRYGPRYLRQFGHVLTSQEPEALDHPGVIRRQAGLLWYYGGTGDRGSFDALAAAKPPPKPKPLSTVCSAKAMNHTLHSRRLAFTRRVKEAVPELDIFGYGMGELRDKADALDPYRYHLAIENHSCQHHWTEKLADAFLGHCLPLYFGCTNPEDYFPPESFIRLDIRDADTAVETVRQVFADNPYEQRLSAIIESRHRVLHRYSTFAQLAGLLPGLHQPRAQTPPGTRIHGRRKFRKVHPFQATLDWFSR